MASRYPIALPGVPDPVFFANPEELRAWFAAHHETASELWVGYWKAHTGRAGLTWPLAVEEALCVGWIDGVVRRIDDERHMQRFTPRKRGSHWSKVNVAKVQTLTAAGRMQPAGLAAFAARSEHNTGRASHERDTPAELSAEQEAAFRADAAAWAWFCEQAPSYRRTAIHLVVSAKRAETQERRLAQLIACSAAGERIPQLRRR
jgi:uncharacterized protein YdeI (YjbR/CyaY-like superfamily)